MFLLYVGRVRRIYFELTTFVFL